MLRYDLSSDVDHVSAHDNSEGDTTSPRILNIMHAEPLFALSADADPTPAASRCDDDLSWLIADDDGWSTLDDLEETVGRQTEPLPFMLRSCGQWAQSHRR